MIKPCPVCDEPFDTTRTNGGNPYKTCSTKCSYALRGRQKRRGKSYPCVVCGALTYRAPSDDVRRHPAIYCSPKCYQQGRSVGYTPRVVTRPYVMKKQYDRKAAAAKRWATRRLRGNDKHTQYTKDLLSMRTTENIMSGKISRVSQLEKDVARLLRRRGVKAVTQYGLRDESGRYCACVDIFVPSVNVAVEVNGTYWHADPLVYRGRRDAAQQRSHDRYERKRTILAERGIRLVEVWEGDFKLDPRETIDLLLEDLRA